MDSKQPWYGLYFKLNQVYEALQEIKSDSYSKAKVHELFMTWVVARFLQWQANSEHVMGFPSLDSCKELKLSDMLRGQGVLDSDNFDTVIADTAKLEVPIRLQIKRYAGRQSPSTEDFFEYMSSKTDRYGESPELNLVFHITHAMKFDMPKIARLLKGRDFRVGSITVFAATPAEPRCLLFSVYPRFTGQLWSPG